MPRWNRFGVNTRRVYLAPYSINIAYTYSINTDRLHTRTSKSTAGIKLTVSLLILIIPRVLLTTRWDWAKKPFIYLIRFFSTTKRKFAFTPVLYAVE